MWEGKGFSAISEIYKNKNSKNKFNGLAPYLLVVWFTILYNLMPLTCPPLLAQ